jgi:hypothetical protein
VEYAAQTILVSMPIDDMNSIAKSNHLPSKAPVGASAERASSPLRAEHPS